MSGAKAGRIPALIYGTAWKKDKTQDLVRTALLTGFRGVDTAAQFKHYREDLVGAGIRDALEQGKLRRSELYMQTKFTSTNGQDLKGPLPYDPRASIGDQVKASVAASLSNLRHGPATSPQGSDAYIDCLVLHSPYPTLADTLEAWQAMEKFVPQAVRTLGISNLYHLPTLQALYTRATVKPAVVQNRFYPDTGYDVNIRAFCAKEGIVYQSFWTLTANPHLLRSDPVKAVAKLAQVSPAVALYYMVLSLGQVSILDGTTSEEHMRGDLEGVSRVDSWKATSPTEWQSAARAFEQLLEI